MGIAFYRICALALGVGIGALLMGCGASGSATDNQSLATVEASLTTLERVALFYTSLPPCAVGTVTTANAACLDPVAKEKIKAADRIAYDAVVAARAGTGPLAAAVTAIDALAASLPSNLK